MTLDNRERAEKIKKTILRWTFGLGNILYLSLRNMFAQMAEENLLVTYRTDGELKAVMRGETYIRSIAQMDNHRIDPQGGDIFKGSFESYAAFLVKARRKKIAEDPGFIERKLELGDNGNPLFVGLDGKNIPTDEEGYPIDGKGARIEKARGNYKLTKELEEAIDKANSSSLFEELFGVVWVGFPPYKIFNYNFRWIKYGQMKSEEDKTSKVQMHLREGLVHSVFHRYPQYGLVMDDLETQAGEKLAKITEGDISESSKVQVHLELVFETETVNLKKTLFRAAGLSSAGDWKQALDTLITDKVRPWIGTTNWDELVKNKNVIEEKLANIAKEINGLDPEGLPESEKKLATSSVRDYGQKIVRISMVQINLKDNDLQKAHLDVAVARKDLERAKLQAEGKKALAAAEIEGRTVGKAKGYAKIAEVEGGVDMHIAEQIGNIGVLNIGGNAGSLLNIPSEIIKKTHPKGKSSTEEDNS